MTKKSKTDLERSAANRGGTRFFAEFWVFLRHNKKWWLAPILICLVLFGLLVLLGGAGIAPFMYKLF